MDCPQSVTQRYGLGKKTLGSARIYINATLDQLQSVETTPTVFVNSAAKEYVVRPGGDFRAVRCFRVAWYEVVRTLGADTTPDDEWGALKLEFVYPPVGSKQFAAITNTPIPAPPTVANPLGMQMMNSNWMPLLANDANSHMNVATAGVGPFRQIWRPPNDFEGPVFENQHDDFRELVFRFHDRTGQLFTPHNVILVLDVAFESRYFTQQALGGTGPFPPRVLGTMLDHDQD